MVKIVTRCDAIPFDRGVGLQSKGTLAIRIFSGIELSIKNTNTMAKRDFQIFTKPIGAVCNLDCEYCYYLDKQHLYPRARSPRMSERVLENYIVQLIKATAGKEIDFFWHGGEPTLLGLEYFRKVVALQNKHRPRVKVISNSIQTNGTLINEDWARFFAANNFTVGISIDGPPDLHDPYRFSRVGKPSHGDVMRGYDLLIEHKVPCDILCVVHAQNVKHPDQVYRFFKSINARYIGFIPLVEIDNDSATGVSERSIPALEYGEFLCHIFDDWVAHDVGKVMVQIFEEVARMALGRLHALCIFRKTCGDVPVVEHNGDFYSCDHYVDPEHHLGNIREIPLANLLEHKQQKAFGRAKFDSLPGYCLECDVLDLCHGGCPKDRIILSPQGEPGLNYLCEGYKMFFHRAQFFMDQLKLQQQRADTNSRSTRARRNDPCPCGSGKKYKQCCLLKT